MGSRQIVSDVNEVTFTVTPGLMVSREEFDRGLDQITEIETDDVSALWQYARAKTGHTPYTLARLVDDLNANNDVRDIEIAALHQLLRAKTGYTDLTMRQADAMLSALTADVTAQTISVTLTEANPQGYPFTNKKQTVALSPARADTTYTVDWALTNSAAYNYGEILIYDKLTNGFKVESTGGASSVGLRLIVKGGTM